MSGDQLRASGLRQEEFAALVGISRPQIANVLAGRFGLSTDVAARLVATVAALPARQTSMGLLHPRGPAGF